MTIATGVAKQVAYKVEGAFGTAAGASGGALINRISSDLDQDKSTFKSQTIAASQQVVGYSHGVKKVAGTLKGELGPGQFSDFIDAFLRRARTAVTAVSGLTITVAGTGPTYTLTRSAGSWLSDSMKNGMVGYFSAGSFNAANTNRVGIVSVTSATVLTVMPMCGVAMVAEGPISTATFTIPGKVTYTPATGHTDLSFSYEHRYTDLGQYELFVGCKPSSLAIALPSSGYVSSDIGFMGQQRDSANSSSSAYFTSPTAAPTGGLMSAASGAVYIGGTKYATVVGININGNGGHTSQDVVGSTTVPAIIPGILDVSGDATLEFDSVAIRNAFDNETQSSLIVWLTTGTSGSADFMAFALPALKFGSAKRDDGVKGLTGKYSFQGFRNSSGGSGQWTEDTTLWVQDSLG